MEEVTLQAHLGPGSLAIPLIVAVRIGMPGTSWSLLHRLRAAYLPVREQAGMFDGYHLGASWPKSTHPPHILLLLRTQENVLSRV